MFFIRLVEIETFKYDVKTVLKPLQIKTCSGLSIE